MLLGFLMAALGLKLRPQVAHPATDWIVPIFILAVPIFDTTLITVSRSRRGLLPFTSPGKDHTAHRLANLGFGQKRAVLILYGVGFISGTLSVLIPFLNPAERIVLCVFFATVGAVAVMRLERSPYENQAKLPSLDCSPEPDS